MLKRIITSLVAICVLIPVLIFSETFVLPAAIGAATVIAIYEMLKCLGAYKKYYLSVPLYLASMLAPFALRYLENKVIAACVFFVFAVLYLMIVFISIIWSHGKFSFSDGLALFAVCMYIIVAMNSILYVRDYGDSGKYIYLLIFMGAWMTDIFAYFTGVFFGKHKLIEDVSPKKTIEGSIGGVFFCAVSFVVFGIIIDAFFERSANILVLAISGVVVSVISQVGDLIMSVIKRHYSVKDYGKLFPGHGGMLDRFDSVLAVSVGMAAICILTGVLGITLL